MLLGTGLDIPGASGSLYLFPKKSNRFRHACCFFEPKEAQTWSFPLQHPPEHMAVFGKWPHHWRGSAPGLPQSHPISLLHHLLTPLTSKLHCPQHTGTRKCCNSSRSTSHTQTQHLPHSQINPLYAFIWALYVLESAQYLLSSCKCLFLVFGPISPVFPLDIPVSLIP